MSLALTGAALFAIYKVSSLKSVNTMPMIFDPELYALKRRAHAFSGIDPPAYESFRSSLDACEARINDPEQSARTLYEALEHLDGIAMLSDQYEGDLRETIENLSMEIALFMETKIRNRAKRNGMRFHSRYLENKGIS
jgi:hypothetical protein